MYRHASLWKKIAFSACLTGAVFVMLEALARGWEKWRGIPRRRALYETVSSPGQNTRKHIILDPELGFRLRPGYQSEKIRINAVGFRGKDVAAAKPGHTVRVIAVGDSITFGWGSGEDLTYPVLLERLLNPAADSHAFEVINAGVPSYSSFQVRLMVERRIPSLQPDVLVVCVGWNDLFYSTHARWTPDILRARPPGVMIVTLRRLALYRVMEDRRFQHRHARMTEQGVYINRYALDSYKDSLCAIGQVARSRGIRLFFVGLPTLLRPDMTPEELKQVRFPPYDVRYTLDGMAKLHQAFEAVLREAADKVGARYVDSGLGYGGKSKHGLFHDHCHPNEHGNQILAQHVYHALVAERVVTPLPPKNTSGDSQHE